MRSHPQSTGYCQYYEVLQGTVLVHHCNAVCLLQIGVHARGNTLLGETDALEREAYMTFPDAAHVEKV